MPIGDIDPRLFDHLIGERQQAWRQRNPECIAVLEIDNNLKSHVQQRPPSVIFRLEVLGLLPAQLTHSRTAEHVSYAEPGQVRSLF